MMPDGGEKPHIIVRLLVPGATLWGTVRTQVHLDETVWLEARTGGSRAHHQPLCIIA
jgi:hypothetical protein